MAQFFKGDAQELKFFQSASPMSEQLEAQKDLFLDGAFSSYVLGGLLYDTGRAPLSNAIPREIFRETFADLFESFRAAGTFESYLSVFRSIFGPDVEVAFTVPDPGKLVIDITAAGFVLSDFVARQIESNAYVLYNVIDDEGDQIVFQTVKGFQSQYDLEQMLFEMVPAGVYTEINLNVA